MDAIKSDINLLRNRYTSRPDSALSVLREGFSNLDTLYQQQTDRLYWLRLVVWSVALIALILLGAALSGRYVPTPG